MTMKRGEIYFATLDPTIGSEIKKHRPVLIISNNASNKMASRITAIPLTSKTETLRPFEVFISKRISKLPKDSKAQCHQIRTLSKLRIKPNKPAGKIDSKTMQQVEHALKIHLGMI